MGKLLEIVCMVTVLVCVTVSVANAQAGTLGFYLNGVAYPNGSTVLRTDIGEGTSALQCTTNLIACCRNVDGEIRAGNFYFPISDDPVPIRGGATNGYYRDRQSRLIRLNRQPNGTITGRFRCNIPQDSGPAVNLYINIVDILVTITPSGTVTVGESYSLECTVTVTGSTDQPTITWLDPMSNTITSGVETTGSMSTLTFNPLAASDAGIYTCRATLANADGVTVTLYVNIVDMLPTTPPPTEPPMPTTSDTTVTPAPPAITDVSITSPGTGTVGESYSLECTVTVTGSTDQPPTITWLDDDVEIPSSDPAITVSGTSGSDGSYSSRLIFNRLAASHVGTYTCRATLGSDMKTASTTITVRIQNPVVVITSSPASPIRPVGSTVTLTCTVDLSPLVDEPVTVNAQISGPAGVTFLTNSMMVNSTRYTSTSMVSSFGRSQSGEYTCTATVGLMTANPFIIGGTGVTGMDSITIEPAPAGVFLALKGVVYANNSVIPITEIGETNTTVPPPPNSNNGLQCITDRRPCCQNRSTRFGQWYFPGGMTTVPTRGGATSFYRNRGYDGTVNLNRLNATVIMPTGLFCCVVPNATSTDTTTTCINIVLELPTTLATTNTPTTPNPSVPSPGNPGEQGSGPNAGVVAGAIVIVLLVIVVVIVAMLAIVCLCRRRKAGKSDFDVSANVAYGQVKVEALGDVGGEYEDPDKLWSKSGQGGRNYEPTECPAHYEFPVSKPEAPPVYATADDI